MLGKDDQQFAVNLYVVPLAGFQLILGVKWLRTLGAILWDFNALTMSFSYHNKNITWQGERVQHSTLFHAIQSQVSINIALEHIFTDFLTYSRNRNLCHLNGVVTTTLHWSMGLTH